MDKARIVSDGTGHGTKVFLADGRELKGITSIRIEIAQGIVIARIELLLLTPQLDVVAPAAIGMRDV